MSERSTQFVPAFVENALALAGRDRAVRDGLFDLLREAERRADDPASFREQIRWPLIASLMKNVGTTEVVLKNGLIYEVGLDSRIEQSLLLGLHAHPDHVWEPQTTRLLVALARGASHVIVGGAYIGDHVLPIARVLASSNPPGIVHAFEPMKLTFERLLRNIEINQANNVNAHRLGLWDESNVAIGVSGAAALASSVPVDADRVDGDDVVKSLTIDEYVSQNQIDSVGLIMLDIEGGEERALRGASGLLSKPWPHAPHLVFEVHRHFVDWSSGLQNTSIVRMLTARGYRAYAIRDFQGNYPMNGKPIEIIPLDGVYLEGPPHGFNLLASKDPNLVERLELSTVAGVSPKLLLDKDPALHHPIGGL